MAAGPSQEAPYPRPLSLQCPTASPEPTRTPPPAAAGPAPLDARAARATPSARPAPPASGGSRGGSAVGVGPEVLRRAGRARPPLSQLAHADESVAHGSAMPSSPPPQLLICLALHYPSHAVSTCPDGTYKYPQTWAAGARCQACSSTCRTWCAGRLLLCQSHQNSGSTSNVRAGSSSGFLTPPLSIPNTPTTV
jgi:hypothetical protein